MDASFVSPLSLLPAHRSTTDDEHAGLWDHV
jgi:hypothetical protein